jgi:hypothetical protein
MSLARITSRSEALGKFAVKMCRASQKYLCISSFDSTAPADWAARREHISIFRDHQNITALVPFSFRSIGKMIGSAF